MKLQENPKEIFCHSWTWVFLAGRGFWTLVGWLDVVFWTVAGWLDVVFGRWLAGWTWFLDVGWLAGRGFWTLASWLDVVSLTGWPDCAI